MLTVLSRLDAVTLLIWGQCRTDVTLHSTASHDKQRMEPARTVYHGLKADKQGLTSFCFVAMSVCQ